MRDSSNGPPSEGRPAPDRDAEWFDTTPHGFIGPILISSLLLVIAAGAVSAATSGRTWSSVVVLGGIAALTAGVATGLLWRVATAMRVGRFRLGIGRSGVWWKERGAVAMLPWAELHAVGTVTLHHRPGTPGGKGVMRYTHRLELFPRSAPDRAHPALGRHVRNGRPPRPGLPDTYLQVVFPNPTKPGARRPNRAARRARAAVLRHRPDLWLDQGRRDARADDLPPADVPVVG